MTSEAKDRSMPYFTSREVIGRPFSNLTPSRRVKVQLRPSSDGVPEVGGEVGDEFVGVPRLGRCR